MENKIKWEIGYKLSTARLNGKVIPQNIWNISYPVEKNDKIIFVPWSQSIYISIHGNTLKDILQAIYDGLNQIINPLDDHLRKLCYQQISEYYNSSMRLDLVYKLENGSLKYRDLLGDYHFFGGNLTRKENGIWYVDFNS